MSKRERVVMYLHDTNQISTEDGNFIGVCTDPDDLLRVDLLVMKEIEEAVQRHASQQPPRDAVKQLRKLKQAGFTSKDIIEMKQADLI